MLVYCLSSPVSIWASQMTGFHTCIIYLCRPCHHIPGGKARQSIIERTDEHHPRIEQAFRNYFYRADLPSSATDTAAATPSGSEETNTLATSSSETSSALAPHPKHEFEIIVCHANVIRYMVRNTSMLSFFIVFSCIHHIHTINLCLSSSAAHCSCPQRHGYGYAYSIVV